MKALTHTVPAFGSNISLRIPVVLCGGSMSLFYRMDPPVMILDEATSSIETRTHSIVQSDMNHLMHRRFEPEYSPFQLRQRQHLDQLQTNLTLQFAVCVLTQNRNNLLITHGHASLCEYAFVSRREGNTVRQPQ